MRSGALLQVQGMPSRLLEELWMCDREQRVRGKFAGHVLKVLRDEKFTSFIVSDGTSTAEVTMVQRFLEWADYMPNRGDSVKFTGIGFKKTLGGKNEYSFLKVHCLTIGRVSLQQQLSANLYAARTQLVRTRQLNRVEVVQKLKPLYVYKTLSSPAEEMELRTLIFVYCYYVFEHNTDIQSYIFNPEMIRCSKNGREFMESYGITKDCLEDVLKRELMDLCRTGLISSKVITENTKQEEQFFLIKRDFFRGVERTLEEKILQHGNKGGINIEQLNTYTNRKIADFTGISYFVFNWKFLQKILAKLQGENFIYKTADKMIYPNFRI